ncbi:MAG: hypothetical protein JW839_15300 [Candidatus Lokiarchaeota archaeon]|nr:hypothetical protein [Candidatus Lokiarchaeota archaeon]
MKDKEEIDSKATYLVEKAHQLLDDGKRNKAMRNLIEAADLYEKIARMDAASWQAALKLAMEYLVITARLLVEDESFMSAARVQTRLGKVALMLGNYKDAADYYNVAAKYALKDHKPDPAAVLHASAMYCFLTYLQAEYEKSTEFLKRILGMFDTGKVNSSHIFSILRDFYKPGLGKRIQKINVSDGDLGKEGFSDEEVQAIKTATSARATLDASSFTFTLQPPGGDPGYVAGEEIVSTLDVQMAIDGALESLSKPVSIKDIVVEKSSDLTIIKHFPSPVEVPTSGRVVLNEEFRSYHAGSNEIGPLEVELAIGQVLLKKKVPGKKFTIHGRPVNMVIAFEKLQEPLVGKPFPLRIEITNDSRGDASNVEVEVELPDEQLQVVRGTLKKKFLALAGGESGSWEVQLVPVQEGKSQVKVMVNYKDSNGKQAEPVLGEESIEVKM